MGWLCVAFGSVMVGCFVTCLVASGCRLFVLSSYVVVVVLLEFVFARILCACCC